MIIAYHAIWTTYGTWLPNDPRGSYSKAVYNAELAALGEVRYGRQAPQPDRRTLRRFHVAARTALARPAFRLDDAVRPAVAATFGQTIRRLRLVARACAIMNDHVHLVLLRSDYRIEYVVNQLKGAATRALGLKRTPWTRGGWKVFLNDEAALGAAIQYVEANPPAAGLPPQRWDFVEPLSSAAGGW
jgi:REP element-mobilizing transposase RayT